MIYDWHVHIFPPRFYHVIHQFIVLALQGFQNKVQIILQMGQYISHQDLKRTIYKYYSLKVYLSFYAWRTLQQSDKVKRNFL